MKLNTFQIIITVLALAVGSWTMRFLPPILFRNGKKHPKMIDELTPLIPPAVIGLLTVYSLKVIDFTSGSHGIPEIISVALVAVLQLLRKNMLLSIIAGTACYMILIRVIG